MTKEEEIMEIFARRVIDESKNWKDYMASNDYANLQQYNFTEDVLDKWDGEIGISERDDNILIIRTNEDTWKVLCGREWHYDRLHGTLTLEFIN